MKNSKITLDNPNPKKQIPSIYDYPIIYTIMLFLVIPLDFIDGILSITIIACVLGIIRFVGYFFYKGNKDKLMSEIPESAKEDFSQYYKRGFKQKQIAELAEGAKKGYDYRSYAIRTYTPQQMHEIYIGMEHGVDTSLYNSIHYNAEQMEQIRIGLEHNIDVHKYLDSKLSPYLMRCKREKLEGEKSA